MPITCVCCCWLQWPALATQHLTLDGLNALTYKEVKGSGIAATCPVISPGPGSSDMPAGTYQIEQFCLEPTAFYVREEGEDDFDPTKVLTRQTYTLDMVGSRAAGTWPEANDQLVAGQMPCQSFHISIVCSPAN